MRAAVVGMVLLCGLMLCGLAVFPVNVINLIDMELIEFCIKWCAELQAWVKNLYEIVRPSPPVAAALTVSLVLFVFMLLVLLLRPETWRSVKSVARANPDVPIIPWSAAPAEDERPDRMAAGRLVQTLLGTLVFPTTHAIGKVGDNLTAIYYTRRGYTKKESKIGKVHGIDGVYVRDNPRDPDRQEVVIVENKINTSGYKPHQLSISGVKSQCHKMQMSEDATIRETAELILQAAAPESGKSSLIRLVVRHDLRTGKSTRCRVDDGGHKLDTHVEWQNKRDIEMVLKNAIKKGRVARPAENGSGPKNE